MRVPARDGAARGSALAHVTGLSPSTTYRYTFDLGPTRGLVAPLGLQTGSFRTAPEDHAAGHFTLATASCMHPEGEQASWYLLYAQNPDLLLLLGDNVYADSTAGDVLWHAHLVQRSTPEFATVIRNVPTVAIWDDHDFGPNDSDGTTAGKEESLETFRAVWAQGPSGTPATPGAFQSFPWGDVEIFMLDGRYHRSANRDADGPRKTMLGTGQVAWLRDALRRSRATFKILASGSTFMACPHDGWRSFGHARAELFRILDEDRIEGVLYLSGDLHESHILEHESHVPGAYPLVEVISSGITAGEARSFATLTFDTTIPDPTIHIRIIAGDGSIREQRVVRRSALSRRDAERGPHTSAR
jgi:alkaline phosphatase D